MEILRGLGAAPNDALGILRFPDASRPAVPPQLPCGREAEKALDDACRKAERELSELSERAEKQLGQEEAGILSAQGMLATDEDLRQAILDRLAEGVPLDRAVDLGVAALSELLKGTGDEYLSRREGDLKDVGERIKRILLGAPPSSVIPDEEGIILACEDLPPSVTATLTPGKPLGLALERGSVQGHTAILCRTLGIGAAVELGPIPRSYEGKRVLLRASRGELILDPDEEALRTFRAEQEERERLRQIALAQRGKPSVSADGKQIPIYANASTPDQITLALQQDADGIGLLRSEVLFLSSPSLPSEREQADFYAECLRRAEGRRLILRLLDIGADKQLPYLSLGDEENPALGIRGIRLLLSRPELLLTQLRAALRASMEGDLSLMIPMVVSEEEIHRTRELLLRAMDELSGEGIPFRRDIELGIMIETPAAALIADRLAEHCDFFSIGTNDLTQYTLAADRQLGALSAMLPAHHPAIFTLIEHAISAAHEVGIWCGICGDLAGDPALTERLVRLGVDELSVIPTAVLPVRAALRESRCREDGK